MLNFFTKALIKRQMKGVPEGELEKMFQMIEQNPEYFKQMAENIQAKMKQGMSQEEAAKAVMESDRENIQKMFGK